jgi:hypothetical protein
MKWKDCRWLNWKKEKFYGDKINMYKEVNV